MDLNSEDRKAGSSVASRELKTENILRLKMTFELTTGLHNY